MLNLCVQKELFCLEAKGIVEDFPGVRALDKVNFNLKRGEVHALVGENGAGKSTFVKILTGVYSPDEGEIFIDGKKVNISNPHKAQELGISIIYQEFNLVPYLSVGENIYLGKYFFRGSRFFKVVNWRRLYEESKSILRSLGVDIDPKICVQDLTVAEQQVVEIAKALAIKSRILIMDEPTSALNYFEVKHLFQIIKNLAKKGVSIIYISHRLEEVMEIGDRVTVFRDGHNVGSLSIKEATVYKLTQMMIGRKLKSKFPTWSKREIGDELLRVKNLSAKAGVKKRYAFRNINFVLHKGEILGIGGIIGSGKSELAKALVGAYPVEEGCVEIMKSKADINSPRDAIRQGIGYLPADRMNEGVVLTLSVVKNITLSSLSRFIKVGFLRLKQECSAAEEYKKELDIRTLTVNRLVMYLSGGNQQKVMIAKWLCTQAKILVFDEPAQGIDVGAKFAIYQLIFHLTKKGLGIILISSEIPELINMCDRILVMRQGEIVSDFLREEASQEKILHLC